MPDSNTARPPVSIAVPTWNGRRLLERFLPSLVREAERWRALGAEAEIVIADDGSTDDTRTWLAAHHRQARVIPSDENRGFAPTANAAVLSARHEIVVLLNNDVELLPGALDALARHFAQPDCFGVTFRGLELSGWDDPSGPGPARFAIGGKLGRFRRGFWSVWDNYDAEPHRAEALPTFFLSGGLCAVRRSVFAALGGFDTQFAPYYWEDVDLSYRARKRGYEIAYEPAAQVLHATSASVRRHRTAFYRAVVIHRNRLLFHWMNLDRQALARNLWWSHVLLLQMAWRGDWAYYPGWWQAVRRLGAVVRRRRQERPLWRLRDEELTVVAPMAPNPRRPR